MTTSPIERRIRWSGIFVVAGLVVQMLTLLWTHPLAFMCFILVGCPLVGLGILLFLYLIVAHETSSPSRQSAESRTSA
jgi:hypothetical protein